MSFLKKYWKLLSIFLLPLIMFFPSLFVFYTNDDFFLLKISNISNITGFLNFFNILHGPEGLGMYRPLTTQVFYFLSWKFFNLNPLGLHIISSIFLFGIIYLVYRLAIELFKNEKVALISAFLYAVSATHFGHLYYLATFQELGMTFFVLMSCLSFLKQKNILSFIFFVLALMSKETAVVTPMLIGLLYIYQKYNGYKAANLKKFLVLLSPFIICLFAYFFIRVTSYGFAAGDSYVWNFSPLKFINTIFWYLLWAFNIPETLLDFIGSGLKVNPNLFLYWSKEIMPILVLFIIQMALIAGVVIKYIFRKGKSIIAERDPVLVFCVLWFLITLLPVAFLPLHKFTFYLTLPLIGVAFRIGYLFKETKINNVFLYTFLLIWTTLSFLTIKHTIKTNWITQGESISKKTYEYFSTKKTETSSKEIYFVDTNNDSKLPWSPTAVVKTALSDNNFFYVYFPTIVKNVNYLGINKLPKANNLYIIESRLFLNY